MISQLAVTHGGAFHVDDVVATAILKLWLPDITVARIREQFDLEIAMDTADIIYDVGFIYDPSKGRFDHHQKGGAGRRENGVEYASGGLIWKHFGKELCISEEAHRIVDERLIQFVDKVDNGEKDYPAGTYALYELVRSYTTAAELTRSNYEKEFEEATDVFRRIVENEITIADAQVASDEHIRFNVLPKYQAEPYVVLDKDAYLWQPVMVNETDKPYVIYPGGDGTWRVRCVPVEVDSFVTRMPLPEGWRGKSRTELQRLSGIDDAVFCHRTGFIGSTESRESAEQMALKSYALGR